MPSIHTLIPDIQKLITRKDGWFTPELAKEFADDVARRLQESLNESRGAPTLRLSKMGPVCPKALWHSIHTPELAEPLPPWAELKFSFGHILEALAITLAKAAGHTVTGEQDELSVDGVPGHRDCVIDGCVVDVKSASSPSFKKFKDKSIGQSDLFGYLDQLDGYMVGSSGDPLVTVKDKGYLFAIDKQLGHMCLYEHQLRIAPDGAPTIKQRIQQSKDIVGQLSPPACNCETVPDGESGNYKLGTRASYSPYKHICFPTLRTAIYSGGPVFFVKVMKWPKYKGIPLQEIDKHGKYIYH